MPKLPAVKPREVARFIENRGFLLDHISGSHFIYFNPASKRRAVIPQHNRDIPRGTLLSILREAGFTREESLQFCRKDELPQAVPSPRPPENVACLPWPT